MTKKFNRRVALIPFTQKFNGIKWHVIAKYLDDNGNDLYYYGESKNGSKSIAIPPDKITKIVRISPN